MPELIECVANFSEGQRREVIEALCAAVNSTPGTTLLDHSQDPDHNRCVLSFVGARGPVSEAAFRAIAEAARLIDMAQHRGAHPRIGAADVVPFIPIEGASLADCVELARHLGHRVGTELKIPVYLYEAAATRPERQRLEEVRRGQYEGLVELIETDPAHLPDFGPARLGSAGAVAIGARNPLIAFNAFLTTSDVSIARNIARAMRYSSGGLRYLKALGLLVSGQAQVAMNFTDFTQTPLHRVLELLRREADRYGVRIARTELIGLIPQAALLDAASWYLQLDDFSPDRVLENRIARVVPGAQRFGFVDELAAPTPTPGGGAASAQAGAMAAALVEMGARISAEKSKDPALQAQMQPVAVEAERLRAVFGRLAEADTRAYQDYIIAKRAGDEAARLRALAACIDTPLATARHAIELGRLALRVAHEGRASVRSDVLTGHLLAGTALHGAALALRSNVEMPGAQPQAAIAELDALEKAWQDQENERSSDARP